MLQLPIELRRLCLEALETCSAAPALEDGFDIDDDDFPHLICSTTLKSLRLVNKELGSLATEQLFRVAVLNHTEESAGKFTSLLRSTYLTQLRHVIINTSEDPGYSGGGQEESEILEGLTEAISIIRTIEKLEKIELKFANEVGDPRRDWEKEVAETWTFRTEIWEALLPAIRDLPNLRDFTVKNLQDRHDLDLFESEDFLAVRSKITKLHLKIATEYEDACPENSLELDAIHECFNKNLPLFWLKPLCSQLTHLSLYADNYFGVWPFLDLREIPTLARLKSLCLGNFAIAHTWQIDWIISHADTLEELIMDDCLIATALRLEEHQARKNFPESKSTGGRRRVGGPVHMVRVDFRWHAIFRRFQAELPHLIHFAIGHGDWDNNMEFEQRYQLQPEIRFGRYGMFDCGIGPSQWLVIGDGAQRTGHTFGHGPDGEEEHAPGCTDEDLSALTELLKVVRAREGVRV